MEEKFTQKELKRFVKLGFATDISNEQGNHEHLTVIGVSTGINGINGALLKDTETSNKYVIKPKF